MFCKKCGVELPDGTRFCSKCGANLTTGSVQQSAKKVDINIKKLFAGTKKKYAIATTAILSVLLVAVLLLSILILPNVDRKLFSKILMRHPACTREEYADERKL